jgi:hypothetical protein
MLQGHKSLKTFFLFVIPALSRDPAALSPET